MSRSLALIDDPSIALDLPWGVVWTDRWAYQPWRIQDRETLAGTMDRYRIRRIDGRPITLDARAAWLDASQVQTLYVLAEDGGALTLTWADRYDAPNETYRARFAPDTPFELNRITPVAPHWTGIIYLTEKTA